MNLLLLTSDSLPSVCHVTLCGDCAGSVVSLVVVMMATAPMLPALMIPLALTVVAAAWPVINRRWLYIHRRTVNNRPWCAVDRLRRCVVGRCRLVICWRRRIVGWCGRVVAWRSCSHNKPWRRNSDRKADIATCLGHRAYGQRGGRNRKPQASLDNLTNLHGFVLSESCRSAAM
jgi:hypothetical protein